MTSENGNNGFYMPVAPAYYGNNGGFGNGFGGDWGWIILLLLCAGGGWGGGFGGGFGGGYDFPWLMNGQQGINNNVSSGFRDAQLNDGITSIRDGIAGLSNQICNSQASSLERSFAAQTANTQGLNSLQAQLAQCCCDNRMATADVKYTIANEASATRAANAQNTQSILDKLCQLELDNYKRENDQLRTQLNLANLQASQVAQTAQIRDGQLASVNALVNELRSCPIPSQPVYGSQPIFTCSGNNGCGCNSGVFYN